MTSMTTAGNRWGVVMSRNTGFSDQVCTLFMLWDKMDDDGGGGGGGAKR